MSTEHETEITDMQRGGFRVECVCGWWFDFDTEGKAMAAGNEHVGHNRHLRNQPKPRRPIATKHQRLDVYQERQMILATQYN